MALDEVVVGGAGFVVYDYPEPFLFVEGGEADEVVLGA